MHYSRTLSDCSETATGGRSDQSRHWAYLQSEHFFRSVQIWSVLSGSVTRRTPLTEPRDPNWAALLLDALDQWPLTHSLYVHLQCEVSEMKIFTVVRALARSRVLDVSLGLHHTCVLVEPGQVLTLGCNSEGQLGNGKTKQQAAPVNVKTFQLRPAAVCISTFA